MSFLRIIEAVRTPALSSFFAAITHLGDETVFMLLAITVFWCVSKRQGYYIFVVGLIGTTANQWLKLIFRVPRPWVLDPDFTIVESARAAATGYSFPSGHTQNVVGTFGCLALANRQKRARAVCAAWIVLVPFSRMYLGVHTPLDVGVSFVIAAALTMALWPTFRSEETYRKRLGGLLGALAVFALAYALWVNLSTFPADVDAANLENGIKNGWTLLGCALGLIVSNWYDEKKLHYDVAAPLLGQICKIVLGLALLLGIRAGFKTALNAAFSGVLWTNAVRYFAMVVFAGCIWPLTFPFFAKLGSKKR